MAQPGRRQFTFWHVAATLPWVVAVLVARASIGDNSYLWHVTAGRLQSELGSVLTEDPFSFTQNGVAWRTQSWLADLAYSFFDDSLGLVGSVTLIRFTFSALLFLAVGLTCWHVTRSVAATALVSGLTALLAVPYLNPRPVVFSYLLAALLVLVDRLPRLRWTLPLLFYLWASVHGSWVIGGAYLALRILEKREYRRILREGPVVLGLVLLSAHGWGVVDYLLAFSRSSDALNLISEWAPPNLVSIARAPFLVAIVVMMLGAAHGRATSRQIWFAVPVLVFGLSSSRSVLPAFLLLIPVVAMSAAPMIEGKLHRPLKGALVAAVFVGLLPMVLPVDGGLNEARFPVELLEQVEDSRLFHDDVVGGYLIYADWPNRQVLVDDRAELYGSFLGEFVGARSGKDGWRQFFDDWELRTALVRKGDALADLLATDGWSDLGEDERWLLMEAPPLEP